MKTHIILIDFENVQPKDLAPLRGRPFKTKVFCGANQNKIPIALADELQRFGPDAEYVRIQGTGPNALDFHIAYYIGRLSAEVPGATFYIVSRDTGFDPLIKHLKTQNVACHRLSSLGDIPGLAPAKKDLPPNRVQKVIENLISLGASRPRRLKTLTTSVKAFLGPQATDTDASDVIRHLSEGGVLTISGNAVTYPQAP